MVEVTVAGANEIVFPNLTTWGWELVLYLFLGGLVAGLMVLGGLFRISRRGRFERAAAIGDLTALPLLSLGMLLLFIDLASKVNVWRLYTTFQVGSPMSWGSWILLLTMVLLAVRFLSRVPAPRPVVLIGLKLFVPLPPVKDGDDEEEREEGRAKSSLLVTSVEQGWSLVYSMAGFSRRHDRRFAVLGVLLGVGVGFYTGVLLSSIDARPVWDSAFLAPLFLVSGLASGAAFLCLFLREDEHERLVPFSLAFCGIEIVLIAAYVLTIVLGSEVSRRAGAIAFGGGFGALFWGVVVFAGLLVPAAVEILATLRRREPLLPALVPPVLKLTGGVTLRFVVVYAGLRCFL